MNKPPVIHTRGLSKTFEEVEALKDLDLTVPPNSIFGFLGPNGAGKTTTMKLLLGLIRPTAGEGSVFGLDIARDTVAIRARTGYLPQEPRFYEHMTARQTLEYTARFYFNGPDGEIARRVEEMLALVGLENKADRPIKGFSGGEQQRLGIAQAQVHYPDLLILDEPAASLDPLGRNAVLDVMSRLRKHATIFYSTHILDDVQRVSDTVAILNRGVLVASGPIETLLAGAGGPVFTISLRGDTQKAHQQLKAQSWVQEIQITNENGTATWVVSVTDAEIAERQLLRVLMADEDLVITDYGRKEYELEEIFVSIVGGGVNYGS